MLKLLHLQTETSLRFMMPYLNFWSPKRGKEVLIMDLDCLDLNFRSFDAELNA